MVLSLIAGVIMARAIAEVADSRKGMTTGKRNNFDRETGINGILNQDILEISRRHGVKPNKDGVLPPNPNRPILDYVKRFADSPSDIDEFKRRWNELRAKQLDEKHERIKTESNGAKSYNKKYNQYLEASKHLSNETCIIEIRHWMFCSKNEHKSRMRDIQRNTIWGKFVVGEGKLRGGISGNEDVEYWELRIPEGRYRMDRVDFTFFYFECVNKCGYDSF